MEATESQEHTELLSSSETSEYVIEVVGIVEPVESPDATGLK
jgi:hypothetical protein